MNKKFILVLEIVWIITGILCLFAGSRSLTIHNKSVAYIFFLLAAVSFLFAWFRDRSRKKS